MIASQVLPAFGHDNPRIATKGPVFIGFFGTLIATSGIRRNGTRPVLLEAPHRHTASCSRKRTMRGNAIRKLMMLVAVLMLPLLVLVAQETSALRVEGQHGQARVIQVQRKNYVEVEGLARITGGSIHLLGNQIVLTLPGSGDTPSQVAPSVGFLNHSSARGLRP